jgi:RHS repeat-associated protein
LESLSVDGILQAEYLYDYLGRQVVRRLVPSGQTIHSVFGPDGNRIAEYSFNPSTGVSTLLREYVWLDGEPVAVIEGGSIYYVRSDHIGRPVFATNASGAVVWTLKYLPFGGVESSTGTPIAARFPGQWFQAESGLHQNWMREYDPTTGRYLQADPLGLVDGASLYAYAWQSPLRWVDPMGLTTSVLAGSALENSDGTLQQCSVTEFCKLMDEEEVDNAKGSGFPGRVCHYRCNDGRWFKVVQIGRQPCPRLERRKDSPWDRLFNIPPLFLPIPKGGGGGGGTFEQPFPAPLLSSYRG